MNKLKNNIKSKIHTIRGVQVMLDSDLAILYEVTTFNLNKAVKRNITRFPQDFMFQLTKEETENLKFQFGISSWGGVRKISHVFTEQGVATLSGILRSKKAIEVNIQIMRAFVSMRWFIASNAQLFQRIDKKLLEHDNKFEEVFNLIEHKSIKPKQGIFFDNQIFDAYTFISDIIRTAKESIILIDNYIDDSVLTLFNKRENEVKVTIYTKDITKKLKLDLDKYNSQYPSIEIKEFKKSHDRFLVIDNKDVYHFGASLKDLGKKWFAFSKFEKEAFKLVDRLE